MKVLGAQPCLGAIYGQGHTTVPELRSCDRGHEACEAADVYYLTFYKKNLLTLTYKIKF